MLLLCFPEGVRDVIDCTVWSTDFGDQHCRSRNVSFHTITITTIQLRGLSPRAKSECLLVSSPVWGSWQNVFFCSTVAVLSVNWSNKSLLLFYVNLVENIYSSIVASNDCLAMAVILLLLYCSEDFAQQRLLYCRPLSCRFPAASLHEKKKNFMASVCKRTIPNERPFLVIEVSANFLRIDGATLSAWRIPTAVFSDF
jgi:hypothetical protein